MALQELMKQNGLSLIVKSKDLNKKVQAVMEYTGEKLHDVGIGNHFLKLILKVQATKEQTN